MMRTLLLVRRWIGVASLLVALTIFVILRVWTSPKSDVEDEAKLRRQVLQVLSQKGISPVGTPWMERIENVEIRLAVQPDFYRQAERNDVVVHFADRVILYRPRTEMMLAQFMVATATR